MLGCPTLLQKFTIPQQSRPITVITGKRAGSKGDGGAASAPFRPLSSFLFLPLLLLLPRVMNQLLTPSHRMLFSGGCSRGLMENHDDRYDCHRHHQRVTSIAVMEN
jgi:hypothetical protein